MYVQSQSQEISDSEYTAQPWGERRGAAAVDVDLAQGIAPRAGRRLPDEGDGGCASKVSMHLD